MEHNIDLMSYENPLDLKNELAKVERAMLK